MAITVKHSKVSLIPDGDDSSVVRPSDWNADHVLTGTIPVENGGTGATTLTGYVKGNGTSAMTASATIPNTDVTGLGTMSTQNANNVAITGGTMSGVAVSGYIPTSAEGVPNGVATLDSGGKVPISQIPDSVIGALSYQGTWNASTNTPTLTSSTGTKGYYYVVNVAGTTNLNGITDWQVGDWAVFNGSVWQKIDNTDAVTSVNGYTGTVVLTQPDIAGTVPTSRTISTGTGLTGGGDLSANRTISFSTASVGTWAATPSSANLAAAMTDETGSGSLVFGTNPTLANPNIDVIDFDTTYATTLTAGQVGWDGNNTLGLGMIGGNVIQHIGEDQFFYIKATSTITKGQVIMFTGAVGASGVPTGAPATGITDGTYIMGIAAEAIATNGFGLVQTFGTLRNVNTSGYSDGDILWYNPSVTGGLTSTKPSAPNVKVQMAAVINGGSSGGGTILIRINPGSTLGGTDSNAQITSPSNGQILTYDGADTYWKNTTLTAGTGISVSAASDGTLTIVNTSPSSGGTVTSVSALTLGTSGTDLSSTVANSTTTPVITLNVPTASSTNRGALSSTDWSTFNGKQAALVSGTNIKTVNGTSLLGSGDLGTIGIAYGGTGQTTANAAFNALAPSQTGNSGKYLTTDGTNTSWATNPLGTVTSVSGTGTVNGLTLTGTVTTSGSLTLGGTLDLSSPPAIGGTTPAAITGTTITATKYVGVSGGTF